MKESQKTTRFDRSSKLLKSTSSWGSSLSSLYQISRLVFFLFFQEINNKWSAKMFFPATFFCGHDGENLSTRNSAQSTPISKCQLLQSKQFFGKGHHRQKKMKWVRQGFSVLLWKKNHLSANKASLYWTILFKLSVIFLSKRFTVFRSNNHFFLLLGGVSCTSILNELGTRDII